MKKKRPKIDIYFANLRADGEVDLVSEKQAWKNNPGFLTPVSRTIISEEIPVLINGDPEPRSFTLLLLGWVPTPVGDEPKCWQVSYVKPQDTPEDDEGNEVEDWDPRSTERSFVTRAEAEKFYQKVLANAKAAYKRFKAEGGAA
jgi:hypothetical protein